MKTFLDRFRRKGKGDEPSDGVPDLFAAAPETKENGSPPAVADASASGKPTLNLTPVAPRSSDSHVRLELGDFLHRIPQNLLRQGPHDVGAELLFNINELSTLIANGQTTINLAEIHRRLPDIFKGPVKPEDKVEVRFPWQKLMHLVKSPTQNPDGTIGITPAAAEALAQKIRGRRPARNVLPTSGSSAPKTPAAPPTPAFREPDPQKPAAQAKAQAADSGQLSWFNKPSGSDKLPIPLPVAREKTPPVSSAPSAAKAPEPAPADEGSGGNREDLVRARDTLTQKLAEKQAEFERQTEALAAERDAIADERDRTLKALEKAKADLAAKVQQIAQHEGLGAQQAKETAETIAQRDALAQEVTAKNAQLAALTEELAALRKGGDATTGASAKDRDSLTAELANLRKELAEKNEQIEFHQSMGAKSAEDAAKLASERETLQKQIAEQSATLDSIKAELDALRKGGGEKYAAVAEERDRISAELRQARQELADKLEQIEFQQGLSSRSSDEAGKLTAERDALQNDLGARTRDLEAIRAELEALAKTSEQKVAAAAEERDRLAADLERARQELTEKNGQVELQQSLSAKTAEDAANLIAEREALRCEVAAKTAELDGIRHELHELRKGGGEKFAAVAEERDSIRAELARAREELTAKIGEIETQKSLADKTVEEFAAARAERDALQKEIASKNQELEAMAADLDNYRKGGGEKLAAVAQERDSLLQQKKKLTDQLAQATAGLAAKQKAVVEVDLSRKENQRQLEELQKRIAAFESGQRATSQELNRERETRIKAERSLAAAERARAEASSLIEAMRTESKRESDAATRKRESEFARAQKEMQERLEALTEAHRKAVAERDERMQEIEKLRTEATASIESIKAAAAAEATRGQQWESRAVAGLEEDIAKYRDRIKSLLGERDAATAKANSQIEELTRAREAAAQELESARAATARAEAEHEKALTELKAKAETIEHAKAAVIEDLEQTRRALTERSEQLAAAQGATQNLEGSLAEVRSQLGTITAERDRLQTDWEKLFAELESVKAEARQEAERFAAERTELEKAGGAALEAARQKAAELEQALTATTSERTDLQQKLETAAADLASSQEAREQQLADLRTEHAAILKQREAASDELAQKLQSHEKAAEDLRKEIADLKSGLDATTGERAEFQRQADEAARQLEAAKAEFEKQSTQLRAEHQAQLDTQRTASDELAKTIAAHAATIADLGRQIEESKSSSSQLDAERKRVQQDLDAAMALLDQARGEHDQQIAALKADHTAELAKRDEASTQIADSIKEREATIEKLRAEITELQNFSTAGNAEREELQKKLNAATAALVQARGEHDRQIAALKDEQAAELAKRDESSARIADSIKEHEATVGKLRGEIADLQKAASASTNERAQLQKKLDTAKAEAKKARTEFEKQLAAAQAEHSALQGAHQKAAADFSAALVSHESTVGSLKADIERHIASAAAELENSKAQHRQELAAARAEQDELRAKHRAATEDFAKAARDHEAALARLQQELSQQKSASAAELSEAREIEKELREQLKARETEFNETKKQLELRLEDVERATAEIADRAQSLETIVRNRDNALKERDADIAKLKEEHESALALLAREHAAGLDSLTAEKDRQLAAMTVDRAKAVASLTRERDDLTAKLQETEQALSAEIATLTNSRDEAVRETTALAQRLAAFAVESDRKIDDLKRAHDAAVGERQTLASQLDAAREEHKAQSGVFAREFKGVVKQRDDTAMALDAARSELAERTAALAREKANLQKVETEIAARFEREVARMRRDRDALIRQRDELHSRISRMVDEQRQLLEELSVQAVRPAPSPADVAPPRAPKETNVIEITAAQIIPPTDPEHGINLPRIRPVPIPPPNVRIL